MTNCEIPDREGEHAYVHGRREYDRWPFVLSREERGRGSGNIPEYINSYTQPREGLHRPRSPLFIASPDALFVLKKFLTVHRTTAGFRGGERRGEKKDVRAWLLSELVLIFRGLSRIRASRCITTFSPESHEDFHLVYPLRTRCAISAEKSYRRWQCLCEIVRKN